MPELQAGRPALYDDFVPAFLDFVRHHRGRRTTQQMENGLDKFFRWLARSGVSDLPSLTALHIRDFVPSLERYRPGTIAVHASTLRSFLTYLHFKGILVLDLSHAVERPRLYRWSEPPTVLDSETVEHLLRSLDRSTALGKRDYAILLLAARYGLRASDIRSLRFENIRWRDDRIVLLQSKTQRQLELPLLADVAAALVDYIRQGRPSCVARELFVRHVPPLHAFAPRNNLSFALRRALKAGHVDLLHHRGLQVLRHSVATQMLANGVALDTISDVLGHGSVETTRRYTQVDLVGLRSVALSETEVRK
jgi:site-specific recombinase XerD